MTSGEFVDQREFGGWTQQPNSDSTRAATPKVYRITSSDWVVALKLEDAIAKYVDSTGLPRHEALDDRVIPGIEEDMDLYSVVKYDNVRGVISLGELTDAAIRKWDGSPVLVTFER